ncbi:putative Fe-S-cluster oxidoreductase [Paraburkholderia caribensis MBA4]|uniref:Putative Fe-S-cluster oxidoreductase n=2 Tax=Paraburkholderia caribensis TaxID=75105 RepID=A0A0N7JUK9_9BURK|nr:putative Fe-S-cluster oxidoreductase [Paraburkholderia caribensis MBA4]
MRAGRIANADTAALIAQSREADERDRVAKTYLCALLGYDTAALANEGLTVYAPARLRLEAALRAAQQSAATVEDPQPRSSHPWHFITNRSTTLATLQSIGASARHAEDRSDPARTPAYLGFFDEDISDSDRLGSPRAPGPLQL